MKKRKPSQTQSELFNLMNVGPATYQDFQLLGINTIQDLAQACPDELYQRIQELTGKPHDPCVWDVFAATINQARTGEKDPWWKWTKIRKKRQAEGTF